MNIMSHRALIWIISPTDVLLDIGTGNGNNAISAAKYCSHVIGLDISKKSLETARERVSELELKNITFAVGSFENPSEEIDIKSQGITKILVTYSLHHLPDSMKSRARRLEMPDLPVVTGCPKGPTP